MGVWETPCDNAKVFGKFLPDPSGKNSAKERVKAEINGNPGGKRQSWRWKSPSVEDESKQICLEVVWGWERACSSYPLQLPHCTPLTAIPSPPAPRGRENRDRETKEREVSGTLSQPCLPNKGLSAKAHTPCPTLSPRSSKQKDYLQLQIDLEVSVTLCEAV